jgi:glycolate oxidase iron-sulfur subunit
LPSCPTHVISGHEMPSPRGRLYLMRAVTEGRLSAADPDMAAHEWTCLVCRACETACPSGVEFGYLMEQTRERLNEQHRPPLLKRFIYTRLLSSRPLLRIMQMMLALVSTLRLSDVVHALGRGLQQALPRFAASLRLMPTRVPWPRTFDAVLPATAPKRGTVGVLLGCVGDVFTATINDKTIDVLRALGYDVKTLPDLVCCGALAIHAGFRERSLELARNAIDRVEAEQVDVLVSNIAGCGAMLKDYEKLLAGSEYEERAIRFRERTRDIVEFLWDNHQGELASWSYPMHIKVAYQAPCHLYHAQKITDEPLKLLRLIHNVEAVELNENELCCGSAGSYNIEHPKESEELLARKLTAVELQGPDIVVTANAGCLMQLRKGLHEKKREVQTQHIIEVLHSAMRYTNAQ